MSQIRLTSLALALLTCLLSAGSVLAQADLSLTLAQQPAAPRQYSDYTVTATLTNDGPEAATGVTVAVVPPAGAVFTGGREFSASQGTFSPYGSRTWTVGELGAGQTATLELRFFLLDRETSPAFAQVATANQPDPDSTPGNGSAPTPREDDEASTDEAVAPVRDLVIATTDISCIDDNGTPDNLGDDTFTALVTVTSASRGDSGPVIIGTFIGARFGADRFRTTYGTPTEVIVRAPIIENGRFSITADDVADPSASAIEFYDAPEPCTSGGPLRDLVLTVTDISCIDDNGTLDNPGDDTFTAVVTVTSASRGDGGPVTIETFFNFGSGPAFTTTYGTPTEVTIPVDVIPSDGGFRIAAEDGANRGFGVENRYDLPEVCAGSPVCDLVITATDVSCIDDKGTPDVSGDDTFTALVTVTSASRGDGGTLRIATQQDSRFGADRVPAVYGTPIEITVRADLIEDGQYNIIALDDADVACGRQAVLPAPSACEQPACELFVRFRRIAAFDPNDTPDNLDDDIIAVDIEVVSAVNGQQEIILTVDGVPGETVTTTYERVPFSIVRSALADGRVRATAVDRENGCRATASRQAPTVFCDLVIDVGEVTCVNELNQFEAVVTVNSRSRGNTGRIVILTPNVRPPLSTLPSRTGLPTRYTLAANEIVDGRFTIIAQTDPLDCKVESSFPVAEGCDADGIDLELTVASADARPARFDNNVVTYTLFNDGNATATGVEVSIPTPNGVVLTGGSEFVASQGDFSPYGNQVWTVGALAPGASATIAVSYFRLSQDAYSVFGEVSAANETDVDSTPGNGSGVLAEEDDEANIIFADFAGAPLTMTVAPNPAQPGQTLRLAFDLPAAAELVGLEAEAVVTDIVGRVVRRVPVAVTPGRNEVAVETTDLSTGVYFVAVPALDVVTGRLVVGR